MIKQMKPTNCNTFLIKMLWTFIKIYQMTQDITHKTSFMPSSKVALKINHI
jgi:hypothetical protein